MATARQLARETWSELEFRIGRADKRLLAKLPGPAATAAIDSFERLLGAPLPPLVRELYAVHDGIGMPHYVPAPEGRYCSTSYFLCIADSVDAWSFLTRALRDGSFDNWVIEATTGGVRAHWWNALWVPVASDNSGNLSCVDLDPADDGLLGQVVDFWHDDTDRNVLSQNLAEFLLESVEEDEWAASFQAELLKN